MLTNLELLRTFLEAANTPTFTGAALRRHVTKSAISQQIKTLEGQLGIALFERVGRQAVLTDGGRHLADALQMGFETIDSAVSLFRASHAAVAGEVRVGGPGPFTRLWIRPRVARLLKTHEALRLTLAFGSPSEIERRLLERDLDLIVLVRPVMLPGIVAVPIFKETFRAYASRAYWKKYGTPTTLGELLSHRFVIYDETMPMHAPWWRTSFGARVPFRGNVVCSVANLYEMRALAKEGVGITILPDYFTADAVTRRELVELPRLPNARRTKAENDILLAWRSGTTETARFIAVRAALAHAGPSV